MIPEEIVLTREEVVRMAGKVSALRHGLTAMEVAHGYRIGLMYNPNPLCCYDLVDVLGFLSLLPRGDKCWVRS